MALNVTGRTQQFNIFPVNSDGTKGYFPGSGVCVCGHCSIGVPVTPCDTNPDGKIDWHYADVSCCSIFCTHQQACSKVDPNVCPLIGGTRGIATWTYNGDAGAGIDQNIIQPQTYGRFVNCIYKTTDFKTVDDIITWLNTFGITPDFDNIVMPAYCGQVSDPAACPIVPQPITTTSCPKGIAGCSRMTASDLSGKYCHDWQTRNPALARSTATTFCNAKDHLCFDDCLCYNRSTVDETYVLIHQNNPKIAPTTDACWYKPCQTSNLYLIPADQVIGSGAGVCPTTVCQQVNEASQNVNSTINFNTLQESISCTLTPPTTPPTPGTAGPSFVQSTWDQWHIWIIIGIVLVVVIIIVIIIIAATRKKS